MEQLWPGNPAEEAVMNIIQKGWGRWQKKETPREGKMWEIGREEEEDELKMQGH